MHGGQLEVHPNVLSQEHMKVAREHPELPDHAVEQAARLRLGLRITKTELFGHARAPNVVAWLEAHEKQLEDILAEYGGR